jgi:hypothetical protein
VEVNKMKFKIERRDGTVIYANDICMNAGCLQRVTVWAGLEEIDDMSLDAVKAIWLLDPVRSILIYV